MGVPAVAVEGLLEVIYGAQRDADDHHLSGFTERLLRRLLGNAL